MVVVVVVEPNLNGLEAGAAAVNVSLLDEVESPPPADASGLNANVESEPKRDLLFDFDEAESDDEVELDLMRAANVFDDSIRLASTFGIS